MSTTTGNQQTYTRQELNSKTVEELKNICRQDRQKYAGFSNYTKRPLIEFILRGGNPTTTGGYSTTGGSSGNGTVYRSNGTGRNFSTRPAGCTTNTSAQALDDYSLDLSNMFNEVLGFESEYDTFEVSDDTDLFNPTPHNDLIQGTIMNIKEELHSLDDGGIVTFELYVDDYKSEMYSVYKKHLYAKNGYLGDEQILMHGTDRCNISEILENDFSLTISTKHGTVYGKGIYFTNSIQKALEYSERNMKTKYIIMSYVHIGDMVQGNINMDIHPMIPGKSKRYDTSVDYLDKPIQFVKKSNNQYNILGILKVELSDHNKLKSKNVNLPCGLVVTNNTSENIIVLFSFIPLTDLTAFRKSKKLSVIPPGDSGKFSTAFGHHFGFVKVYPGTRNPSSVFNTVPPEYLDRIVVNSKSMNVVINNV